MNRFVSFRKRRIRPAATSKEHHTRHVPRRAWPPSPLSSLSCKIAAKRSRWCRWPMATRKISPETSESQHTFRVSTTRSPACFGSPNEPQSPVPISNSSEGRGRRDKFGALDTPSHPINPTATLESPIEPQSPVPIPSSPAGRRVKFGALFTLTLPIDPQGIPYIWWLVAMNTCFMYNAWAVPLRAAFPYQTPENTAWWLLADALCDALYLADLALVKPRLMFMRDGFWVHDLINTRKNYRRKFQFKMDALSLVPLEVLYAVWGARGGGVALLRLPRLLRLQTFWDLHGTVDRVLSKAYSVRIGKTLAYIFYLIHVQACAYYTVSAYEGIGSNGWVFDGEGSAYIRCFYFATKTATSIGKSPTPEHEAQYIFMTIAWLIGVFVFALLIGQIRHIINMATRQQSEYRHMLDHSLQYLRRLNLPEELQKRVSSWFIFTWKHQGCFDESRILASLPLSLRRALSLRVHGAALAKSSLLSSASCERALMRELVLALRPVAYLPGDAVCRRGDVGHEMYIVNSGQLLVMSADGRDVLATLNEGSVFGEISLLGIPGADRRTATVRSRGYSQLFALSKNELEDVLEQYPDAQAAMHARAEALMRVNAQRGKT